MCPSSDKKMHIKWRWHFGPINRENNKWKLQSNLSGKLRFIVIPNVVFILHFISFYFVTTSLYVRCKTLWYHWYSIYLIKNVINSKILCGHLGGSWDSWFQRRSYSYGHEIEPPHWAPCSVESLPEILSLFFCLSPCSCMLSCSNK